MYPRAELKLRGGVARFRSERADVCLIIKASTDLSSSSFRIAITADHIGPSDLTSSSTSRNIVLPPQHWSNSFCITHINTSQPAQHGTLKRTQFQSLHDHATDNHQLPLGLLTAAQGHPMLVELKNGETLNGHLVQCDTYMNLTLKEVVQTSPEGDKFFRLPECYVRGNNVSQNPTNQPNSVVS
jgi:small nuclear ribonucleoprotein (snRNP)-like protein